MDTGTQLEQQLMSIHRRSYPAYKGLQGSYRFPGYILHIDHVQGDPFAAPSKVSVEVDMKTAGFPADLFDKPYKRIALQDFLIRRFGKVMSDYMFQAKGSGKSGLMSISRCGQEVLERTALELDDRRILVRFEVGFPANGRTINAPELKKILFDFVPECVKKSLYYKNLNGKAIEAVVNLAEDQQAIREELKKRDLAAFVANGAVLPRESGVSDKPMKGAVAFESPKSMEIELTLPHKGAMKGMGIPRGITLIVGGGYHGKSTLLKALELGVYNHIAGDGREYVITDDTAMKIRAEDGRAVSHVNISPFINHLPNGKDTEDFSTEDASGSTSQAANVVEAVESGAGALLIDEDTSATNFMVRDALMQSIIAREKEPITPFIEQARKLYEEKGVSVILVAGSSGAYFYIADKILQMDTYRTLDITEKVKAAIGSGESVPTVDYEWKKQKRFLRAGRLEKKHGQVKIKQFGKDSFSIGHETVDLKYVEQISDSEQTTALSYVLKTVLERLEERPNQDIEYLMESIWKEIRQKGLKCLVHGSYLPVSMAEVRRQEIYACINRYRGYRKQ
ncbi:ABC-ATPase domain-containing protein [Dorea acetigenes]|uniref:ABC-ATPase domain-containing protein n=1 Tax=Dorea acetigenes TaxID=2981787 RepID=A0ABT2RNS4_9FIRM|nr:ABC-ATPase domain-containing protein [Dorea acetigenes]MCU6687069.1 ABC-ATPase domain-containing protein [Dorea acetigenes]SCJ24772.1 Predicted ATPase of the ABC class [uncultured Clostridium sp.]